jgi:hypothetical protein
MASDITGSMNNNLQDGYNRLDRQHATSRGMPSQMLGQTLGGLMQLSDRGYGESRGGMDQFYQAQTEKDGRPDYSGVLDRLTSGYNNVSSNLSELYGTAMNSGGGALRGLFDSSLGKLDLFKTPMELAAQARQVDVLNRRNSLQDQIDRASDSLDRVRRIQSRYPTYGTFPGQMRADTYEEQLADLRGALARLS